MPNATVTAKRVRDATSVGQIAGSTWRVDPIVDDTGAQPAVANTAGALRTPPVPRPEDPCRRGGAPPAARPIPGPDTPSSAGFPERLTPPSGRELVGEVADLAVGVGIFTFALAPFALPALFLTALVMVVVLIPGLVLALLLAPFVVARHYRGLRDRSAPPTAPAHGGNGDAGVERRRTIALALVALPGLALVVVAAVLVVPLALMIPLVVAPLMIARRFRRSHDRPPDARRRAPIGDRDPRAEEVILSKACAGPECRAHAGLRVERVR